MAEKCIRAIVSGRVQGVFFRDSTRRQALQLGITGHAKNLVDGKVEVLACGEMDQLNSLIDWLHQGPEMAHVIAVEIMQTEIKKPDIFSTG